MPVTDPQLDRHQFFSAIASAIILLIELLPPSCCLYFARAAEAASARLSRVKMLADDAVDAAWQAADRRVLRVR